MTNKKQGKVYTFYSYKGGVGRSMALANIAVLLAQWGQKVLVVDWDLEAPGLHQYFQKDYIKSKGNIEINKGILDILLSYKSDNQINWKNELIKYDLGKSGVDLLSAGSQDKNYTSKLRSLNWQELVENSNIYDYLNNLRNEWIDDYDFVLIDSRTGVTDIGDICTVLFPDILVMIFASNYQNIEGIKTIIQRVIPAHNNLPVNRSKLLILPIPSRTEPYTEYDLNKKWQRIFESEFKEQYYHWIPQNAEPNDILNKIFIPYISKWSFGEAMPVLEDEDELYKPTSIGNAYSRIANLVLNNLDWNKTTNTSSETISRDSKFLKKVETLLQKEVNLDKELKRINRRTTINKIVVGLTALTIMAFIYFAYVNKTQIGKRNIENASNDTLLIAQQISTYDQFILNNGSYIKIADSLQNAEIFMERLILNGNATIIGNGINGTNGKDGRNGINGKAGIDGGNGENGTFGEPGTNGKTITIIAKIIEWKTTDTLYVDVSGGNGGNGGNGGRGGDGGPAYCISRGDKYVISTKIKNNSEKDTVDVKHINAGNGGNGGNGGIGGDGGNIGKILLVGNSDFSNNIVIIEEYGNGGVGGNYGVGGKGGASKVCPAPSGKVKANEGKNGENGIKGKNGNSYVQEQEVDTIQQQVQSQILLNNSK